MALIVCKNCGKPVSDTAAVCVHCGFELKPKEEQVTTFFALPENKQNELSCEFDQTHKELRDNYDKAEKKLLPSCDTAMIFVYFLCLIIIIGWIISAVLYFAVVRARRKLAMQYKIDYMIAFEKWLKKEKNLTIAWEFANKKEKAYYEMMK